MKQCMKKGFGFGLTSGVITTIGLMVGLNSSTHSRIAVIAGILIIAISDALSDALGIHISEEAENRHTEKEIWVSTISTLISKFIFAISFIIPVLLLSLSMSIYVSIIWGILLVSGFSYYIAKQQHTNPIKVILEHVSLTILVVLITHFLGDWISASHLLRL